MNPTKYRTTLIRMLFSLSLIMYGPYSYGHHPHDTIDALAVSPFYSVDKTVYTSTSYHLFRSTDGGYSWRELTNGLDNSHPVSSIVFAPSRKNAATLFVSTLGNGIYRSTNGGTSWKNVSTGLHNLEIREISARSDQLVFAIDNVSQLHLTRDGGETWETAKLPQGAVITAVSPPAGFTEAGILAGDSLGRILLSTDNGTTWKTVRQLPEETRITAIAFDPSDSSGSTYFIGTEDEGLYKTADKGASFHLLDNGLSVRRIISLAFSPDFMQDHTIFVTSWREAVFISSDGGNSWHKHDDGLTTSVQADTDKYRSPQFRQVKTTGERSETMFLAGFDGLFKSNNGGHNWHELETLPVSLIKGLDLSPAHDGVFSVGIGTYGGGAYISHDQGSSWIISNKGLNKTRISDIKFSPSYPEDRTVFSGARAFLLKSTDGGTSWEQIPLRHDNWRKNIVGKLSALGIPRKHFERYLTVADIRKVYPTFIALSPDYSTDKTVFFGTRLHGMYRSEDGGHNAYNIWQNAEGAITSIAVSPNFLKDHTLFIFVLGDGIYKSTDRGDSWRRIVNGLAFAADNSAAMKELLEHHDFSIGFSPGYSTDNTLYAAGPVGLFKSTDQGENWVELDDNIIAPAPNILAMDISPGHAHDHTLLLSIKGRGLYKSIDGGKSFIETGHTLIRHNHAIELIAYSSEFPKDNIIFAASDENLFRSSDGGDNWTPIQRPARYEDSRDIIHYEGRWIQEENNGYSATTVHYSETKGARATLDFFGCGIRWIAARSPQGGIANVYIDESLADSVELHSERPEPMSEVYSRTDLSCAPHSIMIELDEDKNEQSPGRRITLDAFDVLPPH